MDFFEAVHLGEMPQWGSIPEVTPLFVDQNFVCLQELESPLGYVRSVRRQAGLQFGRFWQRAFWKGLRWMMARQ